MELRSENEALEREVVTKTKEVERLVKDLDALKKENLDSQQAQSNTFKTIFEEQDLALDAQVRGGAWVDGVSDEDQLKPQVKHLTPENPCLLAG